MIFEERLDELTEIAEQYGEIVKQISIGRVDSKNVLGTFQRILCGGRKVHELDRYLLPLYKQKEKLSLLNEKMSDELAVPDKWISHLYCQNERHAQSLTDLKFLCVVQDTLEKTVMYQIELLKLQFQLSNFNVDVDSNLRELLKMFTFNRFADKDMHTPGVYLKSVNLMECARTNIDFSEIMKDAVYKDQHFAGIAAIAAYALQDSRLIEKIGDNYENDEYLPKFACLEVSGPGCLCCRTLRNSDERYDKQLLFGIDSNMQKTDYFFSVPTMI